MTTRSRVDHHLGPLDQIPQGEGREFLVAGRRVAVFRTRPDGVAATQAACPHRGGPLADGIVGLDSVVCPLHSHRFSLGDGAALVGDCDIAVHPVRVDARGELVVALPDGA